MNIAVELPFYMYKTFISFILLLFFHNASSTAARGELQPTIVANRRGYDCGFVLRANWRVLCSSTDLEHLDDSLHSERQIQAVKVTNMHDEKKQNK